jgi:hypothetical protein
MANYLKLQAAIEIKHLSWVGECLFRIQRDA